MSFPRNSLRAFLTHAKRSFAAAIKHNRKVTIVIGNESADLDSLTSAILYAYFSSLNPFPIAFTPLYVPLLNIPASDIGLRPEFSKLFTHVNISASHLMTRNDLCLPSQADEPFPVGNSRWILVDHNKLPGSLGVIYGPRVHGVIDHHAEEGAVTLETKPEPRIIEKSGSCTSLVVQHFRSKWDAISDSSLSSGAGHAQCSESLVDDTVVTQGWDAQIAKFALASILEDTRNLSSPNKTTAVDREMVAYLEAKIHLSQKDSRTWDRNAFYYAITEAKRDVGGLSAKEILRKDYKEWDENGMKLGISSMVKPLSFLVGKTFEEQTGSSPSAVDDALIKFMTDRELSILAIMTASTLGNGNFQRELLMQASSSAESTAAKFVDSASDDLALEHLKVTGIHQRTTQSGDGAWRATWLQKDTTKSRKEVGPLIRQALS